MTGALDAVYEQEESASDRFGRTAAARTPRSAGNEGLLLVDDPDGTCIKYTYFVTVHRRWLEPVYAWPVSACGPRTRSRFAVDWIGNDVPLPLYTSGLVL